MRQSLSEYSSDSGSTGHGNQPPDTDPADTTDPQTRPAKTPDDTDSVWNTRVNTRRACTRRNILRGAGLATLAVGAGLGLAACAKPGIAVRAADVAVGGGKILTEANYVVTQPAAGQYKAFVKTCPHALCPVSSITDSQIVCHCHNSRFSITDGSVIAGPAKKGLGDATVTVSGGTLTVTA